MKSEKPPVPFKRIKGDDYDDGSIVQCIEGTLTSIYPPKKGESDRGPWEFQNGKIKDSEGTEMDISFSKCSQPMTVKGQKVTIRSVKTEQHGWNGLKVEDQSFTPQGEDEPVTKRVLKVTSSANIEYHGAGKSGKKEDGKPGSDGGTQTGGSGKWQGGCAPYMPHDIHPEDGLADITNLHARCTAHAKQLYPMVESEPLHTLEFIHTAAATIFIEACRQGLQVGYMERASKPIPPKITPPPEDPALWKTCMIPGGSMIGKTLEDLSKKQFIALYDAIKEKETKFANCVKRGFEERGFLKERQDAEAKAKGEDEALHPEGDDIPF